ncbi:beta-galactosidase GalA [Pontiella sulfatireligans]|uniref:Beta-galactosidase BoGH2A n=1 Tax=Pontiella sulfatireligans TaxID=2750658 RepID=A0A6C2UN83_9BACT|nr:beta-galactosidase GalA [Pontiella sulfatireligans]VGO21519.1 Beta-galactosidase BoGH2A [Pontiella sulfatireligans]
MREIYSMNPGWRFLQQDVEERNFQSIHERFYKAPEWMKSGNQGLSKVGYPDESWQILDLPHDFLQENGFSPEAEVAHGSIPKGVAWYRKTFELPAEDNGRRIHIEFDGIYRDSSVWVNGHFVGRHLSGYTSFCCDISELLNYGAPNSIAVRCDARLAELWSYEGGGIYRDVRLIITDPVRVDWCGTFVRTEGDALTIETTVRSDLNRAEDCEVRSIVLDANGKEQCSASGPLSIGIDATATLTQTAAIPSPILWDTETPYLYTLKTIITVNGETTDEYATTFGVRDIRFDGEKGFFLNGRPLKLRGICNHQDHAGVGTAIPDSLQEWRMLQMKKMGANALRVSHNPPTPALLDICDRLGILVMDETRLTGSSPEFMQQLEDLLRRDRNHPSVIMWSLGNEEMNVQWSEVGVKQLRRMQHLVHKLDPSRSATYSMNCDWLGVADIYDEHNFHLDVFGANYTFTEDGVDESRYDKFHAKYPDWPLIGSETGGSFATRGLYNTEYYDGKPIELNDFGHGGICWNGNHLKGIASAYNNGLTPWGSNFDAAWKHCAERDFMAGTFLWTGFDYRGETYPFDWPATVTRFGLMDLCGFPKDAYFYYKAWWNPEPQLHLFPHWSWAGKEGQPIKVRAYTNCAEVELILNSTSLVRQAVATNEYFETMVDYQPGTLEAIGYAAAGNEILRTVNETVGAPAAIRLIPDRTTLAADARDTAVCRVEVVDAKGRLVPDADHNIRFTVEGPANIIGVGNGNPTSHEPPKGRERKAFYGLCQALLQSTFESGPVILTAEADGLESGRTELSTNAAEGLAIIPGILEHVDRIEIDANPVDGIL